MAQIIRAFAAQADLPACVSGGFNANEIAAAVPEPEVYALMLAGLGAIGFAARRRNRRSGGPPSSGVGPMTTP